MVFKESENIELQSVVIDDIKKEIIAFANCKGEILYIDVEYDGSAVVLNRKKRLQISPNIIKHPNDMYILIKTFGKKRQIHQSRTQSYSYYQLI